MRRRRMWPEEMEECGEGTLMEVFLPAGSPDADRLTPANITRKQLPCKLMSARDASPQGQVPGGPSAPVVTSPGDLDWKTS